MFDLISLLAVPVNMPAPLGFADWLTFWMTVVIATLNSVAMCFAGYKFLQVIQQSGYKLSGCFVWLKDTKCSYFMRLLMISFLSCSSLLVTNVLLEDFFVYKIMTYSGLIFYLVFLTIFIVNMYSIPQKKPLKCTWRMNRLIGTLALVVFVSTFYLIKFSTLNIPYFDYGAVGLSPILLPVFILVAFCLIWPFEKLNNLRYENAAKRVMEKTNNLTVIGITGSYAKTSVKNILNCILSEKFKVCATPHSFNTPMGLSKTILNDLKKDDHIFIAEMGAKHRGDIAYLCNFVKPNVGILTGIGNQHLSTFGSVQNLENTKFELVDAVEKNGGKMFFNADSEGSRRLLERTKCEKYSTAYDDKTGDLFVDSVVTGSEGTDFDLCYKKKKIHCSVKLLGKHNVSNILVCVNVALRLGMSIEEIAKGIEKLVPTAHRLAIVPSSNSLVVIDDAYNGSVEGTKAAIEVLKLFDGKKIVITPGLVELGKEAFNVNFEFGKNLAVVCDYVIIDGVINYDAISSGLEFGGFESKKILRAGSLRQAVEVLQTISEPGAVVLFENDLPDNML